MPKLWKPLNLRRVRGQPQPGQLIALRRTGHEPFYDIGRVKIIDGRRSYYSTAVLGAVKLSDESDLKGIEWMPLMERRP